MSKPYITEEFITYWRSHQGIQSLSFHDRGVLITILELIEDADAAGLLLVNGRAMTDDELAQRLGLEPESLQQTLGTLLQNDVLVRDPETNALTPVIPE